MKTSIVRRKVQVGSYFDCGDGDKKQIMIGPETESEYVDTRTNCTYSQTVINTGEGKVMAAYIS